MCKNKQPKKDVIVKLLQPTFMTRITFAMQTHWMRYGFIYGLLLSAIFAFKDLDETPACAISLDKQNVFYIGVDNPVSVVVRGVPLEDVQVRSGNLSVVNQAGSPDRYTVRANTPGEATITVSGGPQDAHDDVGRAVSRVRGV